MGFSYTIYDAWLKGIPKACAVPRLKNDRTFEEVFINFLSIQLIYMVQPFLSLLKNIIILKSSSILTNYSLINLASYEIYLIWFKFKDQISKFVKDNYKCRDYHKFLYQTYTYPYLVARHYLAFYKAWGNE